MIRYGVCGGPDMAAAAAAAGYDYIEWTVGGLLAPRESDEVFAERLERVRAAPLPCSVVNCFVPADLKITGDAVDEEALSRFVATVCQRAKTAGVEQIVFGSGGSRSIPDDFDPSIGHAQLLSFGSMVGEAAREADVVIVLEPLNVTECNVLTTVGECAEFVARVDHPNFRLLVDAYHLLHDGDALEDIVAAAEWLAHVHIATMPSRLAPAAEPCDLDPFFKALADAGYAGRVSIEAHLSDPEQELAPAIAAMKALARDARAG